jgi:hypothetical protein
LHRKPNTVGISAHRADVAAVKVDGFEAVSGSVGGAMKRIEAAGQANDLIAGFAKARTRSFSPKTSNKKIAADLDGIAGPFANVVLNVDLLRASRM